jgi:hypothetical protein
MTGVLMSLVWKKLIIMNCMNLKNLLGKIKKNQKSQYSAKKLTRLLMNHLKSRLYKRKSYWPGEFTAFLEHLNASDADPDEKFCMISDPRGVLGFILDSEIKELTNTRKSMIFKSFCCDHSNHNGSCDAFWEQFLYYLKEFILTSLNNQNDLQFDLFPIED